METVLKKGKVEVLLPDKTGGGLTGETHTIEYDSQKYVLRRCATLKKAKYYEDISRDFEEYGFLPKYLGRIGKNVFYEFIEGRDLGKVDRLNYIKQVGKILSTINEHKHEGKFRYPIRVYLDELESGEYKNLGKIALARSKRNIVQNPAKLISSEWKEKVLQKIGASKRDLEMEIVYDCTDPTPSNFRVREGKVYLVDIDSIKPAYKGIGASKFFNGWGNTNGKRESFIEGYGRANLAYYSGEYRDFLDLNFLVRRLWFSYQVGKEYQTSTLDVINEILKR